MKIYVCTFKLFQGQQKTNKTKKVIDQKGELGYSHVRKDTQTKVVVKLLLQLKREFYVCRIYLLWDSLVVDTCNILLFSGFYWNLESMEPFSSCKGLLD